MDARLFSKKLQTSNVLNIKNSMHFGHGAGSRLLLGANPQGGFLLFICFVCGFVIFPESYKR